MCSAILLYGLESHWLLKADRDKPDVFYVRCLRQIAKIAPSFTLRFSNKDVLSQLQAKQLSQQLIARQLVLFGKICVRDSDNLSRAVLLEGDGAVTPRTWGTARRVGRPCLRWSSCVHAIAVHICDHSKPKLRDLIYISGQSAWKNHVYSQLEAGAFPVNAPS